MTVAAFAAAIDEVNTRFIAVFADGGDTLPLKVPLLFIGEVSALVGLVLTGYGRSPKWRAMRAAVFVVAAYTLWLPATVVFLFAWPALLRLGLVHAG